MIVLPQISCPPDLRYKTGVVFWAKRICSLDYTCFNARTGLLTVSNGAGWATVRSTITLSDSSSIFKNNAGESQLRLSKIDLEGWLEHHKIKMPCIDMTIDKLKGKQCVNIWLYRRAIHTSSTCHKRIIISLTSSSSCVYPLCFVWPCVLRGWMLFCASTCPLSEKAGYPITEPKRLIHKHALEIHCEYNSRSHNKRQLSVIWVSARSIKLCNACLKATENVCSSTTTL